MRSRTYTIASLLKSVGLAITLMLVLGTGVKAQSYTEGFNDVNPLPTGWAFQNLSTPVGTVPGWFQGNTTVFIAQSGPDTSYIGANFNNVTGANTISNCYSPLLARMPMDILFLSTPAPQTFLPSLTVFKYA